VIGMTATDWLVVDDASGVVSEDVFFAPIVYQYSASLVNHFLSDLITFIQNHLYLPFIFKRDEYNLNQS